MKKNRLVNQEQVRANFKSAKLLIIEDKVDHWALMQQALHQCLPEVSLVWVSSPQQALTQLESWHHQEWEAPKLILQELYLPGREDGWALLTQIKAMPFPFNHIPLVMLSASSRPDDIKKGYELGIATYLIKPLELSGWLSYIQELRVYWWETAALLPIQYNLHV